MCMHMLTYTHTHIYIYIYMWFYASAARILRYFEVNKADDDFIGLDDSACQLLRMSCPGLGL